YAQSGGVTAVINTTAAAVIAAAAAEPAVGRVFAAKNGVLGVLHEELAQTWRESKTTLAALAETPGGAFGSCRVKLPALSDNPNIYRRLMAVFRAHKIRYFLYNGGNDSADTALKLSAAGKLHGWDLVCVGIPKTIDNDLSATDSCPGFGSAAKYIAVSIAETTLDLMSMARTSTKVFVLEVMGRNAGWLAAAAGLAAEEDGGALLILPPEAPFRRAHFAATLRRRVQKFGYAVVAVSEGARDGRGEFLAAAQSKDAFSHRQLGGVAPKIAEIAKELGYKSHWAVADYMQRAARHIASQTDAEHAAALGAAAVKLAVAGKNGMAPIIRRRAGAAYRGIYRWSVGAAPLESIANRERNLPAEYYEREHYRITPACRRYLAPLIRGEAHPKYGKNGLPAYARLKNILAKKKLPPWPE
ncbi:MAG: 6-phosphofructokinase, partial [Betaproteobacteria bacterium]|nr:6-phosphofructokinase [Betaproteobacteria bacterium]